MERVYRIIFLGLCLVVLSGCASLEMDLVIEENGNVDISYLVTVQQTDPSSFDIGHVLTAARDIAVDNGFHVTPFTQEGHTGLKASKSLKGVDLREADQGLLGYRELPSIFKDFSWQYTPGIFENYYGLQLDIHLEDIIDINDLNTLPSDLRAAALDAIEQGMVEVSITLPGSMQETNAENIEVLTGQKAVRYSWTIRANERETVSIRSMLEKSQTRHIILLSAGFTTLLLLLILVLTFLKRRKRRQERPVVY